ncbi:Protein of unknown function [Gryllus bimaculatus]|nr:Protein of unknown function [Gryllus bimaculatus]
MSSGQEGGDHCAGSQARVPAPAPASAPVPATGHVGVIAERWRRTRRAERRGLEERKKREAEREQLKRGRGLSGRGGEGLPGRGDAQYRMVLPHIPADYIAMNEVFSLNTTNQHVMLSAAARVPIFNCDFSLD